MRVGEQAQEHRRRLDNNRRNFQSVREQHTKGVKCRQRDIGKRSAHEADVRQVGGIRLERNTGGKEDTGNTGEQEVDSDNTTHRDRTPNSKRN